MRLPPPKTNTARLHEEPQKSGILTNDRPGSREKDDPAENDGRWQAPGPPARPQSRLHQTGLPECGRAIPATQTPRRSPEVLGSTV